MNNFWKAALVRALRTVAQTLVSTAPTGIVVTVQMVKSIDINALWAVVAWLATGLLAGALSILTSIANGLPEVEPNIVVKAYDDYDEDGSPIVSGDKNGTVDS